ncbi:DUF2624 family protein [Piscibacillus salipiscarius]|uniref:DUF2624 family protein n=1 Tax=Piscibacillus salipiscarius TaxID=299480 RepID=A0ABW5Q6L1_9BACI
MLKHLIRTKLYASTPDELMKYSKQYGISLTRQQANQLLQFIKKESIDPFSKQDRSKTYQYVEQHIGRQEAQQAERLLNQLAKQYNLDHLL